MRGPSNQFNRSKGCADVAPIFIRDSCCQSYQGFGFISVRLTTHRLHILDAAFRRDQDEEWRELNGRAILEDSGLKHFHNDPSKCVTKLKVRMRRVWHYLQSRQSSVPEIPLRCRYRCPDPEASPQRAESRLEQCYLHNRDFH